MNEEMMSENIETEEVTTVATGSDEETTKSGGGLLKVVAVGICAVGAAGAYLYKTKGKRQEKKNERMAKKLSDAGYTVYKDTDNDIFEHFEGEETEETED